MAVKKSTSEKFYCKICNKWYPSLAKIVAHHKRAHTSKGGK